MGRFAREAHAEPNTPWDWNIYSYIGPWIFQLCLPNLAGCLDEKAELLRSWKIHIGP